MIETIDERRFPTQLMKEYDDVLRLHLTLFALLRGIETTGEGAHHDLIRYARDEGFLSPDDAALLDELRLLRNQVSYQGESVNDQQFRAKKPALLALLERCRAKNEKLLTRPSRPSG